jgi:hypothetical protein
VKELDLTCLVMAEKLFAIIIADNNNNDKINISSVNSSALPLIDSIPQGARHVYLLIAPMAEDS